ncbi:MAG: hypothetical protein HYX76_15200 [Acidobacteria bacterium]|nr:hypothetical protein [Acidobacteriota bacterium]
MPKCPRCGSDESHPISHPVVLSFRRLQLCKTCNATWYAFRWSKFLGLATVVLLLTLVIIAAMVEE